jgi:hypothetical protein
MPEFESFSRFRELNVKTLLYYQVELAYLEGQLKVLEDADSRRRGLPEGDYAKWAVNLIQCQEGPSDLRKNKQWKVVDKIRKILKEYSKTYKYDPGFRVLIAPCLFQMKPYFSTQKYQDYPILRAATLKACGHG